MTADPAARLAAALADRYRLERELGQGGMATVYLAHDLKHDRQVAIKVLRPELAAVIGAERFLSEIKTTANLQHPHILPLFDSGATHLGHSERSEESGRIGTEFLYYVMPFIQGETLRDRLIREKQLPVADAVRIATEVADALDYAHRRGVIHRDIKPENILLHDGRALVADFGIALAASKAGDRMTQTGMSLGTPSYMSPEQAMGERDIDARSDVYALGAVTYEMLTGEPPFTGATVQAIVARVLTEEPRAISLVRKTVPPHVEATILQALAKLPADRFSSAAEFARALGTPGGLAAAPGGRDGGTARVSWRRDPRTLGLAAVTALLLLAAAVPLLKQRAAPSAGDRLAVTIDPPPRTRFIAISWAVPAITPDGKAVVFAARGPDGSRLYLRRFDEFEARPLPGTEDAVPSPTMSPDGKWIWFPTTGLEMKKVALSGATGAVSLGPLPDWWWSSGAQWSGDSLVYFVGPAAVWAVETNAGSRREVASLDTVHGERAFASAFPVPDARLLISVATDSGPRVALREQDGRRRWIGGLAGTVQAFLPPDLVIVSQPDGRLLSSRLDLAAARVSGNPVAVASGTGAMGLALSTTGTSAYFALQRGTGRRLVWVERNGRSSPTPAAPGEYRYLSLSPDGQRVSFYGATASEQFAASVIDLRSGGKVTLPSLDYAGNPMWERNGRNLLVAAGQLLPQLYMRQAADGAGKLEVAFTTPVRSSPSWHAPDGSIIIEMLDSTTHLGVIDPAGRLRVAVRSPGTQRIAKLSPDGQRLAYMSNESGRFEIYVQPWPALDRKVAVSTEGGTEPVWGPDGTELFFRHGGTLMASKLVTGPTLQFSRPEPLFDTSRYTADPTGDPSFDVGPDGRFLMIEDDPETRIELRVETSALAPSRARQ